MEMPRQQHQKGRGKGPARSLATLKAHDASFECCISCTLLIKRRPPQLQFPLSHPHPPPPPSLCVAAQCIVCVCALKVTPKLTPAPTSTTLRLFIGFSCCGSCCCCCSPLLLSCCFFFFLLNCQLSELLLLLLLLCRERERECKCADSSIEHLMQRDLPRNEANKP